MKHLLLFALIASPAASLQAQTDQTIIDRAQQPGQPPALPSAQPGATVAPGDADAGNQRIAEPRKLPLKLFLAYDAQAYYTDNVNLAPDGAPEDYAIILAQTAAVRAEFKSHAVGDGLLTPSVGFNFQRYYHGVGSSDHEALDFDSYSVPVALRYRFGNNWEATAGLTGSAIYSLEGPPKYDKIFRSYTPSASLRKLIAFANDRILSVGGSLGYSFTKSSTPGAPFDYRDDRNDKADASLDVVYYHLLGKWVVSPYARLAYSDYDHYQEAAFSDVDRRDITGSVGLSVSYNFNSWANARVFTSYDWRNPQGESPVDYGYTTTNAGVGLTLSASF